MVGATHKVHKALLTAACGRVKVNTFDHASLSVPKPSRDMFLALTKTLRCLLQFAVHSACHVRIEDPLLDVSPILGGLVAKVKKGAVQRRARRDSAKKDSEGNDAQTPRLVWWTTCRLGFASRSECIQLTYLNRAGPGPRVRLSIRLGLLSLF